MKMEPRITFWSRKAGLAALAMVLMVFLLTLSGCGSADSGNTTESNEDAPQEEAQTVDEEAEEVSKEPRSLEDYTWTEIASISSEISSAANQEAAIDIAKGYGLVGSDGTLDGSQAKKIMLADGTETAAQIAGFLHDSKTAGGKAGITFILTGPIGERAMNASESNDDGSWEKSGMRAWLTSDGLELFPAELKNVIVPVDKLSNNVGMSARSVEAVSTTSDSLWLFSLIELAGETKAGVDPQKAYISEILNAEGSQYQLFENNDVTMSHWNSILERHVGRMNGWWLRSSNGAMFRFVDRGGLFASFPGTDDLGVTPGFCV